MTADHSPLRRLQWLAMAFGTLTQSCAGGPCHTENSKTYVTTEEQIVEFLGPNVGPEESGDAESCRKLCGKIAGEYQDWKRCSVWYAAAELEVGGDGGGAGEGGAGYSQLVPAIICGFDEVIPCGIR